MPSGMRKGLQADTWPSPPSGCGSVQRLAMKSLLTMLTVESFRSDASRWSPISVVNVPSEPVCVSLPACADKGMWRMKSVASTTMLSMNITCCVEALICTSRGSSTISSSAGFAFFAGFFLLRCAPADSGSSSSAVMASNFSFISFPFQFLWQSYEKSRAKQRNSFLFLPRCSKFAISDGKVTKKRAKNKTNAFVFSSKCHVSSPRSGKAAKNREVRKAMSFFVNGHFVFYFCGHFRKNEYFCHRFQNFFAMRGV